MSPDPSTVLSIRVGGLLRDRLERIRQSFANTGHDRRISDIARDHLEKNQIEGETLHDEYTLLKGKSKSLRTIKEKLDSGRIINRYDWSFLVHLAHEAYLLDNRTGYTSRLLADAVRAFGAVIRLRDRFHVDAGGDDMYYFRNLMCLERTDNFNSSMHTSLAEVAEYCAGFIEKSCVTQLPAEFLMRNLLCALRDEPRLPEVDLHEALVPYRRSLFVLAAKGYSVSEKSAYIDRLPSSHNRLQRFFKVLETENYKLDLLRGDRDLTGAFHFRNANVCCGMDFPDLEDLAMSVVYGIKANGYEIHSPIAEWGTLQMRSWRAFISEDDLKDLRCLFSRYLEDRDVARERDFSHHIWGEL